jgi:DNA repair exonuclease SbcCD ATPase subunit
MPQIETEINNVLGQLVDFNIMLQTDEKNINAYIVYDDDNYWPLELTSGMERFISSLAIRNSLISITNLPKPNFIAIDEGFTQLDSENMNQVYLLFNYLKTQFDFMMIISHIDVMRDMVEHFIDIKKEQGFSKVSLM